MTHVDVLTRSRLVILFLSFAALLFIFAPGSEADGQKNCSQLLKELKAAQATWQESFDNWSNKSDRVANAVRRSKDLDSQLKRLFADTVKAEADAEACAKAEKEPALAPLTDCAKAAQRVRDLKAESARLEQELRENEKLTEKLEDESAAAHESEKNAAAALEAARLAYAKCGDFWVGRITRRVIRAPEPSTTTVTNKVAGEPSTTIESKNESREELIQIDILPDPPLPGDTNPVTSVIRRIAGHDHKNTITEGVALCRGKGVPRYKETVRNEASNRSDTEGSARTAETVLIDIQPSGYSIRAFFPAVTIREKRESRRTNRGCPPPLPDTVSASDVSSTLSSGDIVVKGRVNPKTPDILKGSEEAGDVKTGLTILTWEVRRIRSKKR